MGTQTVSRPQVIVTDIEGTTSSIEFVHQVLFPYAAKHLPGFIAEQAGDPGVQALLQETADLAGLHEARPAACIEVLQGWIAEDRKVPPLKALQGMIWKQGFEAGDFTGHIYPDAVAGLRRWHAENIRLYIYSSGSVEAQQLIFGYSDAGDLRPLFSGYFDTRVGAKRDPGAYRNIQEFCSEKGSDILFLSDVPAELDAAHAAGFQVVQLRRDDAAESQNRYPAVSRFDEILFN